MKNKHKKSSRNPDDVAMMLNTGTEEWERVIQTMKMIEDENENEDDAIHSIYYTLKSPKARESLSIPTAIWNELEPHLQEKMKKIRDKVRNSSTGGNGDKEKVKKAIPQQYPSLASKNANRTSITEDLVATCNRTETNRGTDDEGSDSGEEDHDDDEIIYGYNTHMEPIEFDEEGNLHVRAHLEYLTGDCLDAISDGGG